MCVNVNNVCYMLYYKNYKNITICFTITYGLEHLYNIWSIPTWNMTYTSFGLETSSFDTNSVLRVSSELMRVTCSFTVHPPVNLFTLRFIQVSQVEHERAVLHTQIKDYISQPLGYWSIVYTEQRTCASH